MRVACCPVLDAVRLAPPGAYTAASLCDQPDWLTDDEVAEQFEALRSALGPRGRVFWRSFADSPPACAALAKMAVAECDTSDDRMPLYWGTWIASVV